MARKADIPGRRRRGLRWLAILAALVLFNACTGLYPLLPIQAVRAQEARCALWGAETVAAAWEGGATRLLLRQTEAGFHLSAATLTPMGWRCVESPSPIAREESQSVAAWALCEGGTARLRLWGFVPEGAEAPELSIRAGERDTSFAAAPEALTELERFTPRADIPGEGGSYFLSSLRCAIPEGGFAAVYIQEQGAWVRLEHLSVSRAS